MKDNLRKLIKDIGFNINELTPLDLTNRILHLASALLLDGHIISFGDAGIGKTTLINSSTPKCRNIATVTDATLFGSIKSAEKGLISDKNDVVFIEQASKLSTLDPSITSNILTHTNGDDVNRINTTFANRTSLVLLGNCDSKYIPKIDNPYPTFDRNFFNKFPDELKEIQGLERFIVLPSFLMEKVTSRNLDKTDEDKIGKLELERIKYNEYNFNEELSAREYKEKCKIITTLNYLLNNNEPLSEKDWKFKGFKAVADSIFLLKSGKYIPYYFENEDGRKLALIFILHFLPENSYIEEAYFLEHRALIKIKGEDVWYKIALDISGRLENQVEFSYYQENKEKYIAEIYENKFHNILLKQKYIPLASNRYKLLDLSFIQEQTEVEKLKAENKKFEEAVNQLKKEIKDIKLFLNSILMSSKSGSKDAIKSLSVFTFDNEQENLDKELLKEELCNKLNLKHDKLKNRFIGFDNNQLYLINFASFLCFKNTQN